MNGYIYGFSSFDMSRNNLDLTSLAMTARVSILEPMVLGVATRLRAIPLHQVDKSQAWPNHLASLFSLIILKPPCSDSLPDSSPLPSRVPSPAARR